MRKLVERLIYRKWFYGFLAAVLWLDGGLDLADFVEMGRLRDVVAMVSSLTAAVLVTIVFLDLQRRWPPPEGQ